MPAAPRAKACRPRFLSASMVLLAFGRDALPAPATVAGSRIKQATSARHSAAQPAAWNGVRACPRQLSKQIPPRQLRNFASVFDQYLKSTTAGCAGEGFDEAVTARSRQGR